MQSTLQHAASVLGVELPKKKPPSVKPTTGQGAGGELKIRLKVYMFSHV